MAALVVGWLLTSLAANPGVAAAPARVHPALTHYSLEAWVEWETATVAATEFVTYTNRTGGDLSSLVFNVTPAYFGSFTLQDARVDGQPASVTLDGVVLEVPLPQPLPPAGSTTVELAFSLQVPSQGGRFGLGEGIMTLGNWYPVVAVYREGRLQREGEPEGWARDQYVDTGDAFFTELADYDVTLTTSQPLRVAHGGELVSQVGNRRYVEVRGGRDFALAISDRYEVSSMEVDGVRVTAYYLPRHRAAGRLYLQAAAEALRWLSGYVGPYPYPSLVLAEMAAGESLTSSGQEYPQLILISAGPTAQAGGIGSYLAYLVVHEVAHQWFYAAVGNDQVHDPWLDEALVTWLSLQFYRQNYPDLFPDLWQQRLVALRWPGYGRAGGFGVDTGVYDHANEGRYFAVVYRQGATFLEEVYQSMGDEPLRAALQGYYETFRGRIATPSAFLDRLQAHTEVDLQPLISAYFSYPRYQIGPPLRSAATVFPWSDQLLSLEPVLTGDVTWMWIYLDERLVWQGEPSDRVTVERPADGVHLLTMVTTDDVGRGSEWMALVHPPATSAEGIWVEEPASPFVYRGFKEE